MSERVLFLALGGTRQRAAAEETRRVVDRGGAATLVVADAAPWRNVRLAAGVRLLPLRELELRHAWMPAEQLLLVKVPRRVLRAVGLGPVKGWSERAARAYQRRIADPLHRRVFLPLLRRGTRATAAGLIRHRLRAEPVDLLVVNDPASMPAAEALLRSFDRGGSPRVAYTIDHAEGFRGDR
jgi:hypothetical protein